MRCRRPVISMPLFKSRRPTRGFACSPSPRWRHLMGGLILQHNQQKTKIMKAITGTTAVASKTLHSKEMMLNLGLEEYLGRGFIAIFLPMALIFINHALVIFAAPVMMYLLITALSHFCILKHAWHSWVSGRPDSNKNNFWDKE